ncbi:integrase catalytic domain-containing protein [Trichonephila clavipes]|nr:integrase catalytic domain-containing protein [Trichonephila clavipes]
MEAAGMDLRKWITNDANLMEQWKKENFNVHPVHETVSLGANGTKVLGLSWNTNEDYLTTDTENLWKEETQWDNPLPTHIEREWKKWCEELPHLRNLKIPRLVLDSTLLEDDVELHSFCDASKKAYGAAIHLRTKSRNGISVKLVTSKSRVAPLNCVTLPRLELLGALVAARLASKVKKIVNLKRSCLQYHWTDSKIVLFWIKGNNTRWKQFVANRVNEITSLTDPHSWYHCAGKENPADFLSRGLSADCLVSNSRWRTGAEFLSDSEFPKNFQQVVPELDYLTEHEKETVVQERKKLPEADRSEETVLLNSDSSSILDELLELSNNYFSKLLIFCLIFSDSTTTVGISPKSLHTRLFHVGPKGLLNAVRQKFWPLSGRSIARKTVHQCVTCFKSRPILSSQIMGNLPSERVNISSPFTIAGLDLCGPFLVKYKNQRKRTKNLSTYQPLLGLTEKITAGFQRGRSTGAVFLDIQKAFDRVWLYFSPEGKHNQHRPRSIPHNCNGLSTKYLGLILDKKKLTWKQHLTDKRDKFRKALRALYPLIGWNSQLNVYNKILLYTAVLRPILTYGSPVWGYAADANIKILEVAQNSIIRNIVKADRYTNNSLIYNDIKYVFACPRYNSTEPRVGHHCPRTRRSFCGTPRTRNPLLPVNALEKLKQQKITFGNPHRIITDKGTALTSKEFREYCENENIQHLSITTGTSRRNGQIERIHSSLIPILSKLSIDDASKRYKFVPAVQRTLNSTISRSTQMALFQHLTGVKMRTKQDLEILKLLEEEIVETFTENRKKIQEEAKRNILKMQEENCRNFNKKRKKAYQYEIVAIQRTQFGTGLKLSSSVPMKS